MTRKEGAMDDESRTTRIREGRKRLVEALTRM